MFWALMPAGARLPVLTDVLEDEPAPVPGECWVTADVDRHAVRTRCDRDACRSSVFRRRVVTAVLRRRSWDSVPANENESERCSSRTDEQQLERQRWRGLIRWTLPDTVE